MSGVLERLAAAFVAPAEPGAVARVQAAPPPAPPTLAVLCAPGDAAAVGGAVALAATRGTAVVAVLGSRSRGLTVAARPSARRLAARLAERGHTTSATGRLVVVELEAPDEAVRVAAAAGVATVTAVSAPRDAAVDRVLAGQDRVLVAGDGILADLAATSVAVLGVPAETLSHPDAVVARTLAAAGVALVAPWRAAVTSALGAAVGAHT